MNNCRAVEREEKKMNFWPLVWLGILIIACVIEKILPYRYAICSAVASFVCIIVSLCHVYYLWQIVTFICLNVLVVVLFRQIIIRATYLLKTAMRGQSLVGRQFTVRKAITYGGAGKVRIDGHIWPAYPVEEQEIPVGAVVEVVEVRRLHVMVKEV